MKTSTRLFILFSLLVSSLCITPNAWADENTNYFRLINRSASVQTCDNRKYTGGSTPLSLQYKISSNGEWKTFTFQSTSPSVPAGDTIYFRQHPSNASKHYVNTSSAYGRFNLTNGDWEVAGDIMTLIYANTGGSEITTSHALFYLFYGCTALKDASKLILPATTLSASCYAQMFDGCSNLQTGPKELPATTIGVSAYFKMFNNCYKLQKAPTIKATVIGNTSMQNMFYNCSTMTTPPDTLYAREIGTQSYNSMFWACKSLTSLPVIMATSFPQQSSSASTPGSAFSTMFRNCSTAVTNVSLDVRFNSWDWKTESYNQTINWLYAVPNEATNTFVCSQALYQDLPLSSGKARRDAYTIPSKWIVKLFPIITFNVSTAGATWDGVDDANRTVDWYGDPGDEFPVPVKGEEVFNGWFTQPTGGIKVLSADWKAPANRANPVVDTILYAQFGTACKFTFVPNGGTWTGGGSDTIELSKPISAKDIAITRTGYAWNGWNPALDINLQPDTATTFTAQWLPLFTFDVNTNGGHWANGLTADSVKTKEQLTSTNISLPLKSWHAFTGWYPNSDGTGTEYTEPSFLENLPDTFYATFSPYHYTFDANGGAWGDVKSNSWTQAELSADPTPLTTPTYTDYSFVEWNSASDGSGTGYVDANNLPQNDQTYYAIWTPEYTYDPNGGTWTDTTATGALILTRKLDKHLERTNWFFNGWNPAIPETMPDTPATFTAQWLPLFTFNPNGGKWEDESTDSKVITTAVGETPTRNGYAFAGWDKGYNPASLPATPTTFTAQWNAFTYTFDVATNGGTWDGESTTTLSLSTPDLTSLTTPKKQGYAFSGWNTVADGSGVYYDKDNLPLANTTFYAQYVRAFTMTAEGETTIGLKKTTEIPSLYIPDLYYSTDNGATWTQWVVGTTTVALDQGEQISFYGTNKSGFNQHITEDQDPTKAVGGRFCFFTSSNSKVSLSGNIMTIVDGFSPTNTVPNYCFAGLFKGMKIKNADQLQLPTGMAPYAYAYTFYNSSIEKAPALPATTVADHAYESMFNGCTSLTAIGNIPATTIGNYAMRNMFYKCTHLETAGNISATTVGIEAMRYMFYNCTLLSTVPDTLRPVSLAQSAYYGMFWECTSMTKAPVIMAKTLTTPSKTDQAELGIMFRNSSNLNNISVRFKDWASGNYKATHIWAGAVASSGTFTCPARLTPSRGQDYIPTDWVIHYIPEYTFDVNGGHWSDNTTAPLVIDADKRFTAFPVAYTDETNKSFKGWNTATDGSGTWLTLENQPTVGTTSYIVTYYAIYATDYTFDVRTNGGTWNTTTGTNDSIIYDVTLRNEGAPVAEHTLGATNYAFMGWNTDAEATTNNLDVDNLPGIPTKYYAIFLPAITFKPNGGTWGTDTGVMDSIFTSFTENPIVTRNGYSFVKWNTAADGSGTDFNWQNPPSSPTTYYAVWDEIVYTFSLSNYPDASWDGSDKTDSVISTTDLLAFGRPVPQLGTQYFGGWTTSPTGTTNELDLANLPTEATTYYPIFHNYLCITALTDNVNIGTHFYTNGSYTFVPFDLHYSIDGINWTKVDAKSRSTFVILANKGDKVYLKGNNPKGINSNENGAHFQSTHYIKFTVSDSASVSGNIMTLISAENPPLTIPYDYSLAKIFADGNNSGQHSYIIHTSDLQLPATELKRGCYESLFEGCAKLKDAPQLGNMTTIPSFAFKRMFKSCSSLTVAPEFAAVTEIENDGCYEMFYGCTSLVDAPTLTATTLAKDCYYRMFYNCSALRSMHVAFTSWGTDNNEYTDNWMYGTTTNMEDHAEFTCAGLPILRGTSNIQVNWKVVIPDIVVDNDAYSSEITNGADITLTNGATLTLNNDFNAVKITVAAGSKLTVPEAYTLTSDTIILQGGDTTNGTYRYFTPEMVVNGHIQTGTGTATPVLYDYLLNDNQYYTLTLPYDVTISDITYLDGTEAVIGIQDYDGAARVQGKGQGAWRTIYTNDLENIAPESPATTLSAGRGYTIYAVPETDKTYSRVRFPMAPNFTAQGEQTKSVNVFGYGCTDGEPTKGNENNSGWNLIGNPYLATCGNSWGTLVLNDNIIDYVIIPANDGQSYHTEVIMDAALPAFKNFFVQVFEDGTLSYNLSSRAQQAPMRSENANTRILAGITLSGNGQEDKMGLTLRDDYTDDYDPYADLSKWMNNSLNLYAVVGEHNLTMAAVNMERAGLAIPLVVKTTKAGTLTFDLNEAWNMNIESLDHLYLEDRTKGVVTDLLTDSYSYEAAKGETKGRFFLYAESAHNTPTDVETTTMGKTIEVIKYIENGRLIILRNGIRFDSTGKCLD